jgi:hypothetical protein
MDMMLMWTSEVFWDPDLDQPGKPAPERKTQRASERESGNDLRSPRAYRDFRETAELW